MHEFPSFISPPSGHSISSGFCTRCTLEHVLPSSEAVPAAMELMQSLEQHGRIDFACSKSEADLRCSTEPLFGTARGHMFGVMVFRAPNGTMGIAKAFSGQFNGQWLVPGWVEPLFDVAAFDTINTPNEQHIKKLGKQLEAMDPISDAFIQLRQERRRCSQALMVELHKLYVVRNFRGHALPLPEVFSSGRGIPTGTGDCCAPKLLNHAICNNLIPLGIAEFYWGRTNRSATKHHGHFYSSCAEKCQPILGFMLCGLEERYAQWS